MPIQLDKILADIANEVALHPNNQDATKKEIDDAWSKVGKNSNLSVHESRSIFKVLQKKYDQEKVKESSAWKLFALMDKIHKKTEPKVELKEEIFVTRHATKHWNKMNFALQQKVTVIRQKLSLLEK
ncbi:uncharacterized protein LOC142239633 [Haematobia irritans]|uniref:uncharacterized protein LOC142239633 n=1 Tax=Haematobia irritans TaxID=7368 RepID=UPI003F50008C